jgi:ABC-type nitrate/sulfonate/bicarbonate transport system ATPase subunit
MHELLIGIWQTKPHRLAIILITHDVAEAISLARPSDALARAGYVVATVNHLVTMSATLPASFVRTP